jgi:hypothetical protein
MKKLILFAAASLIAGQAGAYAQSDDHGLTTTKNHYRRMGAYAYMRGNESGIYYRTPEHQPATVSPPVGNDPDAKGNTNGGE